MSNTTSTTYPPGYLEANRSRPVLNVAIAFIVVDIVFFVLRTWARWLQKTKWMWSDVFMPLSLIFNLGCAVLLLIMVHFGTGRHEAALSDGELRSFFKCIYYALPLVYLPTVVWSKFAILDIYLHVFRDKFSRITCWVLAAVMVLNCIINIPIVIWQCDPISTPWTMNPNGHCDNIHAHYTWASFPNILTDFVMILLPIPMIIKLHQSMEVKLGIFFTFVVGNVGLATSIVRLTEFYYFGWNEKVPDATWLSTGTIPWCVIEPSVYHMAACMITFRPLIRWAKQESPLKAVVEKVSQSRTSSTMIQPTGMVYQKRASGNEPSRHSNPVNPYDSDRTLGDGGERSSDDSLKHESEQSDTPPPEIPADLRPNSSSFITVERSFQVRRNVV